MIESINRSRGFLYINLAIAFLLLNGVLARSGCRLDLTRDRLNSISDSTAKVLASAPEPLLIEAYITRNIPGEYQSGLYPLINSLQEIARVGGDRVRLRMIDPVSDYEREQAQRRGIMPLEVTLQEDFSEQRQGAFFGIYVQQGEKSFTLNLTEGNWFINDLEYRFLRELKRLNRKQDSSGVGIVRGPGLSSTESLSYQASLNSLQKDGASVLKALLEKEYGRVDDISLNERVPGGVRTLLIIGLPRLEQREIYELDQFLLRGGNVLLMAKGFDFDFQDANPQLAQFGLGGAAGFGFASVPQEELKAMNEWLGRYGIIVEPGVILEPSHALPVNDIMGRFVRRVPYPAWAVFSSSDDTLPASLPALQSVRQIVAPWFSTLDLREAAQPNVRYQTLIRSGEEAYRRQSGSLDYEAALQAGRSPGDQVLPESAPVAALARGRFQSAFHRDALPAGADAALFRESQAGATEGSLAVIGTPYMLSDILLRNETGVAVFTLNRAFVLNLLEELNGDSDLAEARARTPQLATISPFFEEYPFLRLLFSSFHILAIPGLLAAYGVLRLYGRNRRRGLEVEATEKKDV
ncbi:MAG: GldG family protein [Leptospirales bacterium]|nr:GldG family protein [Leptospirales bacterium]